LNLKNKIFEMNDGIAFLVGALAFDKLFLVIADLDRA
jgi:hypothetical protein